MTFLGRTLAMSHREVLPFTPSTYDDAHPIQFFGDRSVTPETAMTLAIAYACTRVISEDIAKLPLHIYESLGTSGKELAPDHEWYDTLHDQANEFQTAIEMREMMTAFALNRGRGIAEKTTRRVRMRGGQYVTRREIVPLHPQLVTKRQTDAGDVYYEYVDPKTRQVRKLFPDEVLIVRGFNGVGVIEVARRSFEAMIAQLGYANEVWSKGPRHAGIIQRPKDAPKWNDENRRTFRKYGLEPYEAGGEKAGRPMLLEDGMTWVSASFSMADSQFVEAGLASAEEGCRWYRVPQHKVQILSRSTNNNIEQQSRDYVSDSLLSWAVRWEQAILRDLLEAPFFTKHNMDALLRGDTKERAEAHVLYADHGIKTVDEVRALEDLNPMGGEAAELRMAANLGGANQEPAPADNRPRVVRDEEDEEAAAIQRAQLLARIRAFSQDAAGRVWNRERGALAKLAEKTGGDGREWLDGVGAFYADFAPVVARTMRLTPEAAEAYCADRKARVWADGLEGDDSPIGELVELAVNPSVVLHLATGAAA
jgi:HK97 family phage portal protein